MSIKEIGKIVFWLGVILCAIFGLSFLVTDNQTVSFSLLIAGVVAILAGGFLQSGQIGGK